MLPKNLQKLLQKRLVKKQFRQLLTNWNYEVDFYSNDYLGIAHLLKQQLQETEFGGSTGSRLISGNSKEHEELESFLATFYEAEKALLFNSGYNANLGVFGCLPQKDDLILYDELSHASIRQGIQLSFAKSYSFAHNNLKDLQQKLKKHAAANKYIAVESVYSMDGDTLDLNRLNQIAKAENAYILLDEAHGTGNLGLPNQKKGLYQTASQERILARIHTFGKALGSHGAVVLGTKELVDFLVNFSKPFIYTTALGKSALQEIHLAHQLFLQQSQASQQLQYNIRFFKQCAKSLNLDTDFNLQNTAIQSYFGQQNLLLFTEQKLRNHGIATKSIFAPTVPVNQERIRISLHSYNTKNQITQLLKIINHCKQEFLLQESEPM